MPSSSSNSVSPPPPPPQTPLCFPEVVEEDEQNQTQMKQQEEMKPKDSKPETKQDKPKPPRPKNNMSSPSPAPAFQHTATPLHQKNSTRKKNNNPYPDIDPDDRSVSCNKCRPTSRDKISVIPYDMNNKSSSSSANPSPNGGIFKSIISNLTKKSPKSETPSTTTTIKEEEWKIAVAELSHKLIQATKKRDEAILEASRLKYSMNELEKKLNKLEIYCHELKTGLDVCNSTTATATATAAAAAATNSTYLNRTIMKRGDHHDKVIESFVNSVAESRSSVRVLSRSLTLQLRQMGVKIYERIALLLQPYDVNISFTKNPRSLLFYLEALLNRAFYEDFEGASFQKNGSDPILNPVEKCEGNYASFTALQGLCWDEVLTKGTRHFSEDFSRFCDRKMSEIVAMLGWNRAWPEPLLQAFFGAAKSVWLVHLLACSVHPSLPIFRVDKDVKFDGLYMEDMGGDKARKLVPDMVRIMVAPGFYVYNNVVKCKVICRYSNTQESTY